MKLKSFTLLSCAAILPLVAESQQTVTTLGGTVNVVPKYSGSATIVNSAIFETGGKVGIGTRSPSATLSVNGSLMSTSVSILGDAIRFYSGASDGNSSYGDIRTNTSTGNSVINAKANALYFNYDHGIGGVMFGNGGSRVVATISAAGNAIFSGTGNSSFAGSLGIGTTSPSSKLTVAGMIQSTSGGFRFPDGTVQTTAGIETPGGANNRNTAVGFGSLPSNTSGLGNTAFGYQSLNRNTVGFGNTSVGQLALFFNTTGQNNTAVGGGALTENTSGVSNVAVGSGALASNTEAQGNTAVGTNALSSNVSGSNNAAFGGGALFSALGCCNTAAGQAALGNAKGSNNTGIGFDALLNATSGSENVALGRDAGFNVTDGNSNIEIYDPGQSSDNGVIRIGTQGVQSSTYIAGINSANIGSGSAVVINSSGQLGTIQSSARFKEDVNDMDKSSDALMQLRPVTFRYKQSQADGTKPLQYGLIGEEVAKVYPELVVYSKDGQVESVQYHQLPALLLNELQKQHRTIQQQQDKIIALENRLSSLEKKH